MTCRGVTLPCDVSNILSSFDRHRGLKIRERIDLRKMRASEEL